MNKVFMQEAGRLALEGMNSNQGGPFGAVIVKDNKIIGRGFNQVLATNDPTAHAEVVAIRHACRELNYFHLQGCQIYTTCEPCPMCLSALYWARVDHIFYGANRQDAQAIGFDDAFFYQEIVKTINDRQVPMEPLLREEILDIFNQWLNKSDKTIY
jgi:tRNA(Arg) A34 adenosine deaminase TadA